MPVCCRISVVLVSFLCLSLLACSSSETAPQPKKEAPDRAAVDAALQGLDGASCRERDRAGAALLRLKAAGPAAAALGRRLGTAANHTGTVALIGVLGRLGGPVAEKALLQAALAPNAHLHHRVEAVYALRRLHGLSTLPGLCVLARSEAPELIRVAALGALGDFTDSQQACRALSERMATGTDRERIEAARCLLCFTAFDLKTAFHARFFDRAWQVRVLAVEHARRHPTDRSRRQLAVTARSDRNLNVSFAARKALRRLASN